MRKMQDARCKMRTPYQEPMSRKMSGMSRVSEWLGCAMSTTSSLALRMSRMSLLSSFKNFRNLRAHKTRRGMLYHNIFWPPSKQSPWSVISFFQSWLSADPFTILTSMLFGNNFQAFRKVPSASTMALVLWSTEGPSRGELFSNLCRTVL